MFDEHISVGLSRYHGLPAFVPHRKLNHIPAGVVSGGIEVGFHGSSLVPIQRRINNLLAVQNRFCQIEARRIYNGTPPGSDVESPRLFGQLLRGYEQAGTYDEAL